MGRKRAGGRRYGPPYVTEPTERDLLDMYIGGRYRGAEEGRFTNANTYFVMECARARKQCRLAAEKLFACRGIALLAEEAGAPASYRPKAARQMAREFLAAMGKMGDLSAALKKYKVPDRRLVKAIKAFIAREDAHAARMRDGFLKEFGEACGGAWADAGVEERCHSWFEANHPQGDGVEEACSAYEGAGLKFARALASESESVERIFDALRREAAAEAGRDGERKRKAREESEIEGRKELARRVDGVVDCVREAFREGRDARVGSFRVTGFAARKALAQARADAAGMGGFHIAVAGFKSDGGGSICVRFLQRGPDGGWQATRSCSVIKAEKFFGAGGRREAEEAASAAMLAHPGWLVRTAWIEAPSRPWGSVPLEPAMA